MRGTRVLGGLRSRVGVGARLRRRVTAQVVVRRPVLFVDYVRYTLRVLESPSTSSAHKRACVGGWVLGCWEGDCEVGGGQAVLTVVTDSCVCVPHWACACACGGVWPRRDADQHVVCAGAQRAGRGVLERGEADATGAGSVSASRPREGACGCVTCGVCERRCTGVWMGVCRCWRGCCVWLTRLR